MYTYLLLAAIVMFASIFLHRLSGKLGVPALLAFILLGMLFSGDGLIKIHFDNYEFAEEICSTALAFIMFYGGFGTNIEAAKPIAAQSILLSSVGVIMTCGLVGLFCMLALNMPLIDALLIGAVISSTDAASVFSVLRSKRLNLKYNTASMLEIESGSNDPFAYMLTAILLSVKAGVGGTGAVLYTIFAQLFYGGMAGIIIAIASAWVLKHTRFSAPGFDNVFMFAIVILSFALPEIVHGNGFLSAYIVGIVLGNAGIKNKRSLVPFFDGITSIMQMSIFFLLGLVSHPSQIPQVLPVSIAIALFMTFIARPVAVFLLLTPFKSKLSQMLMVSWSGLRGAASIVFAVMVMLSNSTYDVFHIVFCVVLFSILIQGGLLAPLAKKLNMIDENEDVMKTFNDYSDEVPVQFIRFKMTEEHPWTGLRVQDIVNPPDTILVLIQRGDEKIVPNGSTRIKKGDYVVLSAKSPGEISGIRLSEKTIREGSKWIDKPIRKLPNTDDRLIIMINRDGKILIPNGDTVIRQNDMLVINHSD